MDHRDERPIDPPMDPTEEPGLSSVELGTAANEGPPDPGEDRRAGSGGVWLFTTLIALLLVGAALYWFVWRQPEPPSAPPEAPRTVAAPPTVDPTADEREDDPAPSLEASDDWVRGLVRELSSHPRLVAWLAPEGLVRRFVAATDAIALGDSPREQLRFAKPEEPLQVVPRGGAMEIDPASYRRFTQAVELFESLDPEGSADAFRRLEPLFDQAYADLGYPDTSFRATFDRATARLLDVPVPDGPIELDPREIPYQFRDPALESLSPAAKLLLRLGPDQARRVQAKIRELRRALDAERPR